ncbi:MAG TPA: hypothetical protein VJG90_02190 [Candidatus Nanoarchaeia archaeon]|nr:hypothetical protein [Candidatus Nanoarchaeia archaeon]
MNRRAMTQEMVFGIAVLLMLFVIAALIYYSTQTTASTADGFLSRMFGGLG